MIPDFNDFHIAIGFTVGYGTPVSVEELITYMGCHQHFVQK